MDKIKTFFSYLITLVLTISILCLTSSLFVRDLLSHYEICKVLKNSKIIEESLLGSDQFKELPEELLEYIDIEDIIYDYVADEFLYEVGALKDRPEIDLEKLNEAISDGIERYIDEKVNSYTGGFDKIFGQYGLDLKIDEIIKGIIKDKANVDISSKNFVTQKDLISVYDTIDSEVQNVKDSSYIFEVVGLFFNDTILYIVLGVTVVGVVLLFVINRNLLASVNYLIVPVALNFALYVALVLVSNNLKFEGDLIVKLLNAAIPSVKSTSFKYIIYLGVILAALFMIATALKKYNDLKNRKNGVTTLDNVFDDYDEESVIREINGEAEEVVEEQPIEEETPIIEEQPEVEEEIVEEEQPVEEVQNDLDIPNVKSLDETEEKGNE